MGQPGRTQRCEWSSWTAAVPRFQAIGRYSWSDGLINEQKDSSQETVISLLGMLVRSMPPVRLTNPRADPRPQAGSVVVSWVASPIATWTTLLLLLSVHLATNYAAVRAVSMRSLNRQRANIVFSRLIAQDRALTPDAVSKRERIFEKDGVLRWYDDRVLGRCSIGVKLETLCRCLGSRHQRTRSIDLQTADLSALVEIFQNERYLLWYDVAKRHALVVLKQGSTSECQLKAWMHALLLAQRHAQQQRAGNTGKTGLIAQEAANSNTEQTTNGARLAELASTLDTVSETFPEHARRLRAVGWDTSIAALETRSGTRAVCQP